MGNMSGSYGAHYTLRPVVYIPSQNYAENTSTIKVELYIDFDGSSYYAYTNYGTSGTININGNVANLTVPSINFESGVSKSVLLGTHQVTVTHNTDGSCPAISITGSWNTDTSRIGSGTVSTSVTPPNIPRYVTILSFEVENMVGEEGLTKVRFKWSADAACDMMWYSTDNGNSWTPFSLNGIVSGLEPNTTYNFKLRLRRTDSQLTTDSQTVAKSTLDIARILNLDNFEHGDDAEINISNSAQIANLNLEMKVNNEQILTRILNQLENTIKFTDDELDKLYKKYGTENEIEANFILHSGDYTNSKTCIVTLTGNQKTVKIKNNNTYKRGKIFIKINGTYKKAVIWINKNGSWRRCI